MNDFRCSGCNEMFTEEQVVKCENWSCGKIFCRACMNGAKEVGGGIYAGRGFDICYGCAENETKRWWENTLVGELLTLCHNEKCNKTGFQETYTRGRLDMVKEIERIIEERIIIRLSKEALERNEFVPYKEFEDGRKS